MRRHGVMGVRMYDFESYDRRLGEKFLQVLKIFSITPVEYNVEPWCGAWVRFLTTEKKRLQIEYVFRNLMKFRRADYLREGKVDLEAQKLYRGDDAYAIY